MHHTHAIGLKCSNHIPVYHETNYYAHLSALSGQLPKKADQRIQRAEHGKAKS